jgi:RNA polymerase sigma factor (sigma-70 family)
MESTGIVADLLPVASLPICAEGDETDPVEVEYLQYAPLLRRLAMRRFGVPAADVDELVNDVFATYLANPASVRTLYPYLRGGICNASRDYWRRRNREVSLDAVADDAGTDEETFEGLSDRLLLAATLARLREKCRRVIFWRYYEDATTAAIASELDTTPANVLYILHKCRERARRIYETLRAR